MSEINERQDVYTRITTSIVNALERGTRPWVRPWTAEHAAGPITRPLRHDGTPYRGINVLSLWATAMERHYVAPIWMTYRQAIELGGHVRKGEKAAPVVYANTLTKSDTDPATGGDVERAIWFLKGYAVFNIEQIDGLPPHYLELAEPEPRLAPPVRIARADAFFAATGAVINHGGGRAFYRPSTDSIQMPPLQAFRDDESYYATLAHEITHWTGHESRLARDFTPPAEDGAAPAGKRFDSPGYAMEELVAELGAAFLCADLSLSLEPRSDHADYIAHWLEILKNDNRAVFAAASHAQRAADFLNRRGELAVA